jgi:hypothetical protein
MKPLLAILLSISMHAAHGQGCAVRGASFDQNISCCEGLRANLQTNLCEDPFTPAAEICGASTTCTGGKACLPRRGDDVTDPAITESGNVQNDELPLPTPRAAGESCSSHNQCLSYACVSNTCQDVRICRFADVGEEPPAGVECSQGQRKVQGKCEEGPSQPVSVAVEALDVEIVPTQIECRYDVDDATRQKAHEAIVSLRAAEWLFSSAEEGSAKDCLKQLDYIRDRIGKEHHQKRLQLVRQFNQEMKLIQDDFLKIEAAKPKGTAMVEVHGQPAVKEGDIATRKSSGYDALMIMYRRNLVFQAFEASMKALLAQTLPTVEKMSQNMTEWKDSSTKWKVGDEEVKAFKCGLSSGFLGLFPPKKIRQRAKLSYELGTGAENASPLNRELVKAYFESLELGSASASHLVDPLMPNGTFTRFGSGDSRRRTLPGTGATGSLGAIHTMFGDKLGEFFQKFKGAADPQIFLEEPELIKVDKPLAVVRQEVQDIAFAQFVAYARHSSRKYSGYFPSAGNGRRKLLKRLELDMKNLDQYYATMAISRDKQSECLERAINHAVKEMLSDEGDVSEDTRGAEKNTNSYAGPGSSAGAGQVSGLSQGQSATRNVFRVGPDRRSLFGAGFGTGSLGVSNTSNVSGDAGTRSQNLEAGTAGVAGQASFSATRAGVTEATPRSREVFDSGDDRGKSTGRAQLDVSNSIASQRPLSGAMGDSDRPQSAGAAGTSQLAPSVPRGEGEINTASGERTNTLPAGKDISRLMRGMDPGSGAGQGDDPAAAGSEKKDGSMSPEESDVIMANYERTRSRYEADEADDLFEIVSKAYVRNLGRVLKRRSVDQ